MSSSAVCLSWRWYFISLDQLLSRMCLTLDLPDSFFIIFRLNFVAAVLHRGGCAFIVSHQEVPDSSLSLNWSSRFDHLVKITSIRFPHILVLSSLSSNGFSIHGWFFFESIMTMVILKWWFFYFHASIYIY